MQAENRKCITTAEDASEVSPRVDQTMAVLGLDLASSARNRRLFAAECPAPATNVVFPA
jgi:hypothetical protein